MRYERILCDTYQTAFDPQKVAMGPNMIGGRFTLLASRCVTPVADRTGFASPVGNSQAQRLLKTTEP